jgi:hypothetical protein
MRFLVAGVAVIGLIVAGRTIATQFASGRSVEAAMTSGISVYQIHLDKPDMKTLPEQEVPLP